MPKQSRKGTWDEKIAHCAKVWRYRQKKRIAAPSDAARSAEEAALRVVATVVDDAEGAVVRAERGH